MSAFDTNCFGYGPSQGGGPFKNKSGNSTFYGTCKGYTRVRKRSNDSKHRRRLRCSHRRMRTNMSFKQWLVYWGKK